MGTRSARAGAYLGLLRRPGEPDSVFTLSEQRQIAVGVLLCSVLLALGAVLSGTGRLGLGAVATCLALGLVTALNVLLRRLRRRRARDLGPPAS